MFDTSKSTTYIPFPGKSAPKGDSPAKTMCQPCVKLVSSIGKAPRLTHGSHMDEKWFRLVLDFEPITNLIV